MSQPLLSKGRARVIRNRGETSHSAAGPPTTHMGSKKRKNDEASEGLSIENPATEPPQRTGSRRNRLLELLSRHEIKKKPRLARGPTESSGEGRGSGVKKPRTPVQSAPQPAPCTEPPATTINQVDYARYSNPDLIDMIHQVGIDARDLNRTQLIDTCWTHHQLIVVPKHAFDFKMDKNVQSSPDLGSSVANMTQAGPSSSVITNNRVFDSTFSDIPEAGPSSLSVLIDEGTY